MAKKKKKKGDKLPYVHIDVIPEDGVPKADAFGGTPEGQDAEDDGIVPFVIPVFRKSDFPQGGQTAVQGQVPGFGTGQFPAVGQGGSPQQDLAQIQNNLLMQHSIAQQQAGMQPSRQPMGPNAANRQGVNQPGQKQKGAPNANMLRQQAAPRQGNPRQAMPSSSQQQPMQQAQHPAQQQNAPQAGQPFRNQTSRPAGGMQGMPAQSRPLGPNSQHANGQRNPRATQRGMNSAPINSSNGRMHQPSGQFAPVGSRMPNQNPNNVHRPQARNVGANAQPSGPSYSGTMGAVAAAAAARADQMRMNSAFGGFQANAALQQGSFPRGPGHTIQKAAPARSSHPAGAYRQGQQLQGGAPHQVSPGSSGPFAPVSMQAAQSAPKAQASVPFAAKPGEPSSTSKVGDPLLDAKAIEESPMFDKPPVSIKEGMKKSESGRKMRRRVIVVILLVLLLAGGGIAAYTVLSQQGVVPQISIETKTVPVTPQGSSSQAESSSSAASSSRSSSSASSGTGSGDLSGTVVYQYSANTASGVEYKVEETVSFQANGDCQSSTMNMTFPDAASAKTFTDNLARDYGSSFKLDSLNGANAVVTIDNSGLHLSRDEYENALRYSVVDLIVLGK